MCWLSIKGYSRVSRILRFCGNTLYILLYLNFLTKITVQKILFSYITVAIGAVALGLTIVLTGIAGQAVHHIAASLSPTLEDDAAAAGAGSHTPKFLNAEAATLPMYALDYTTLDVVRDGDAAAGPLVVQIDPGIVDEHCEYCFKINYSPYLAGKAGIAWKTALPLDVQNSQRMVFWAKGEYGGEQIRVMILGKPNGTSTSVQDENLFDNVGFVSASESITLDPQFNRYQVDVPNVGAQNFDDITHAVALEIDGGSGVRPVVVYIKGFIFDGIQPQGNTDFILENEEILGENVTTTS